MPTTTDNTTKALNALKAEYERGAREFDGPEALTAYIAELDVIAQEARDIKALYKNKLAVIASQKSRQARKERVAKALAMLAQQEALEAAGEKLATAVEAEREKQAKA